MKTEQQQPKVLYSKALSGSLPPTQPSAPVVVSAPVSLPPPPSGLISPSGGGNSGMPPLPSVVGLAGPPLPQPAPLSSPSASSLPSNVSALVGSNLYHSGGGNSGGRDQHHKGGNSGGSQFGGGGPNGRNSGYSSPGGNMRGMGGGGNGGKGSGGQSPYSNRHSQQPYQNSRMPSNSNTSSASPPMVGNNGSASGGGHSPNGGSLATNGNGSVTPEGGKSSLLSDRSLGGGDGIGMGGDGGRGGGSMHHSHHSHHGGGGHHRGGLPAISKTNLYIRGLTENTTDKDLHSLCSPYGNIISTKAILDKETNKCRGYGFVDFEHPNSAELAVKSLISQGVQAQMAKCSEASRHKFNSFSSRGSGGPGSLGGGNGSGLGGGSGPGSINEHDPTNLYIANLPLHMTEHDLETMLTMYGSVVSTRILKDSNGAPRGVGFARMESKEKCDNIISILNGKMLPGCKDHLLVKFADGGNKKKHYKHNGDRGYRNDVDLQMNFDSTNLATNGVPTQLLPSPLGAAAAANAYQRAAAYSAAAAAGSPYAAHQNAAALQANWLAVNQVPPQHGYIMQPQMIPSNMDPNAAAAAALQYSPLMHQITAQMSHLQLGGAGYMPGAAYGTNLYPQQLIQSMTLPGEESINPSHSVSSGSASGEDPQQQQQQQQQHTYQQQQQQQMAYASQLQK